MIKNHWRMTLVYLYDHYNHASSAVNQKCLICLSLSYIYIYIYIYILCIKFVVGGRLMMARKKTRKHLALCKRPLGMKYVRTLTILLEFFWWNLLVILYYTLLVSVVTIVHSMDGPSFCPLLQITQSC